MWLRNDAVKGRESEVLGYVAIGRSGYNVLCDGDSCVVAESAKLMRRYIARFSPVEAKDFNITEARYGQVLQALRLGAAYSFDQGAFERFRPLATTDGMDLTHVSTDIGAWPVGGVGIPLTRIQGNPA